MEEPKKIEYRCVHCQHGWVLHFQPQAMVPVEIKCPECNKLGRNEKPYNFFRGGSIQVTYHCESCGITWKMRMAKPEFNAVCSCGGRAKRLFNNVSLDKEDDNISFAKNAMLYGTLPSGKDKVSF